MSGTFLLCRLSGGGGQFADPVVRQCHQLPTDRDMLLEFLGCYLDDILRTV